SPTVDQLIQKPAVQVLSTRLLPVESVNRSRFPDFDSSLMLNLCYDNEDILEPLVVGINRHLSIVEDDLKALEDVLVAFQVTQTDFDWSRVQASRMDFHAKSV